MIRPESVFEFCIQHVSCHAECYSTQWVVPAELPYFEGHFPGHPVLPAVAIIDASTVLLSRAIKTPNLALAGIKMGKFVGLVQPGMNVEITLHKTAEKEWTAEWKNSGQLLASIALRVV